jgi:hypothetical protein
MIKTASAVFGDDVQEGDSGEEPANSSSCRLTNSHSPTYDRPKHLLYLVFAFVRSAHQKYRPGCPLQETVIGDR